MAISSVAFSPKEFRVAIQQQTALGTPLTNLLLELNVDSISHGTLGGINNYDIKSGGGRIFQDEHYFHQNSDYISEISLSGIYTVDTCFPLLENILYDVAEPFTIASNYNPTVNIKTGASLTAGNSELLTLADTSTGSEALNCRFESTELGTDEEENVYIVNWIWKCQHIANMG